MSLQGRRSLRVPELANADAVSTGGASLSSRGIRSAEGSIRPKLSYGTPRTNVKTSMSATSSRPAKTTNLWSPRGNSVNNFLRSIDQPAESHMDHTARIFHLISGLWKPPVTFKKLAERVDQLACQLCNCTHARLMLIGAIGGRSTLRILTPDGKDKLVAMLGAAGHCAMHGETVMYEQSMGQEGVLDPNVDFVPPGGPKAPLTAIFIPVQSATNQTVAVIQAVNKAAGNYPVFDNNDAQLLSLLGNQVAAVLRQLDTQDRRSKTVNRLHELLSLMPTMATLTSASSIAYVVATQVKSLFGVERSTLLLCVPDTRDLLTWLPIREEDTDDFKSWRVRRVENKGIRAMCTQDGEPIMMEDQEAERRYGRSAATRNALVVPLIAPTGSVVRSFGWPHSGNDSTLIGLLEFRNKHRCAFDSNDESMAAHLASVLANLLCREDVQLQVQHDEGMERVNLTGKTVPARVLQAEKLLQAQVGCETALVLLNQPDGGVLVRNTPGSSTTVPTSLFPLNIVTKSRKAVSWPTDEGDPNSSINWSSIGMDLQSHLGLRSLSSCLVVALPGGEDPQASFGVAICANNLEGPLPFPPSKRRLANRLAAQLAEQLYFGVASDQANRRRRQLERLAAASLRFHALAVHLAEILPSNNEQNGLDCVGDVPSALIQDITAEAIDAAQAEWASFQLLSIDGEYLLASHNSKIATKSPSRRGVSGLVIRSRNPLSIADTARDSRFMPDLDQPKGLKVHSIIAVPVVDTKPGSLLGVLTAYNAKGVSHVFSDDDLETLKGIASATTSAIGSYWSAHRAERTKDRIQSTYQKSCTVLQSTLRLHTDSKNADDVLQKLAEELPSVVDYDVLNIYSVRPGLPLLFPIQIRGRHGGTPADGPSLPLAGIAGQSVAYRQAVYADNPYEHPSYDSSIDRAADGQSPSCILCIPLTMSPSVRDAALQAESRRAQMNDRFERHPDKPAMKEDSGSADGNVGVISGQLNNEDAVGVSSVESDSDGSMSNFQVMGVIQLIRIREAHPNPADNFFTAQDVVSVSHLASQTSLALAAARRLQQVDTVPKFCRPILSSRSVRDNLQRAALGLCQAGYAAIFYREKTRVSDELVSYENSKDASELKLVEAITHFHEIRRRRSIASGRIKWLQKATPTLPESKLGIDKLQAVDEIEHGPHEGSPSSNSKEDTSSDNVDGQQDTGNHHVDQLTHDGLVRIRVPIGTGILGACAKMGQVISLTNPMQDPRFEPGIDDRPELKVNSILCVPIFDTSGEVTGVIQLLNKPGSVFETQDIQAAKIFSLMASSILSESNARRERIISTGLSKGAQRIITLAHSNHSAMFVAAARLASCLVGGYACVYYLEQASSSRWKIYHQSGKVQVRRRSGMPSACVRSGDIQLQSAIAAGDTALDLPSDDEAPKEIGPELFADLKVGEDVEFDTSIEQEQQQLKNASSSQQPASVCVPFTGVQGAVSGCFKIEREAGSAKGFSEREVEILERVTAIISNSLQAIDSVAQSTKAACEAEQSSMLPLRRQTSSLVT